MFKTKKYCECLNLLWAKNKLLQTLEKKPVVIRRNVNDTFYYSMKTI